MSPPKPKPSFPASTVQIKLGALLGSVGNLAEIRSGQDSQTFRFRYGNQDLILRLNVTDAGFRKDAFAFHHFSQPALPIPKIFRIGSWNDHTHFCISQHLPGTTLQELKGNDLQRSLASTAAVLEVIGTAELGNDMTGYGPFDDRGAAPFQSWRDWLLSIMDPVCSDLPIMSGVTNRKLLDLVLPRFAALTENCPEVRKLVHGDFGSNNVLAEGECITSVLDWSEAMIGDPAYDIANVLFWRTWLPCMEELAAWFERAGTIDRTGRKRLLCYALRIGLREVYENVRDGNHGMGGWALNRCNELLQSG